MKRKSKAWKRKAGEASHLRQLFEFQQKPFWKAKEQLYELLANKKETGATSGALSKPNEISATTDLNFVIQILI
jgi:hypothetical protein